MRQITVYNLEKMLYSALSVSVSKPKTSYIIVSVRRIILSTVPGGPKQIGREQTTLNPALDNKKWYCAGLESLGSAGFKRLSKPCITLGKRRFGKSKMLPWSSLVFKCHLNTFTLPNSRKGSYNCRLVRVPSI